MSIVECNGLEGKVLEECVAYYDPIYSRNVRAVMECEVKEPDSFECMDLYGARCKSDAPPPAGAKIRNTNRNLYEKYMKLVCGGHL